MSNLMVITDKWEAILLTLSIPVVNRVEGVMALLTGRIPNAQLVHVGLLYIARIIDANALLEVCRV